MSRRWWPAGAHAPPPHARWWPAGAAPPCDNDKHLGGGIGGEQLDDVRGRDVDDIVGNLHRDDDHDKHFFGGNDGDDHDKHFFDGFGGNLNDEHEPHCDDDRGKRFYSGGDEYKLHRDDGHDKHDNDDNDEHDNRDKHFFSDGDEHKLHHNDGHDKHDNDEYKPLRDNDNDKHLDGIGDKQLDDVCGHDVGEALRYIIDKLHRDDDHGKHSFNDNDEYKPHRNDDHGKHFVDDSGGSLNDEHEPHRDHLFSDNEEYKLHHDDCDKHCEYEPQHNDNDKHLVDGIGDKQLGDVRGRDVFRNIVGKLHLDDDHDEHPFNDDDEYNTMDVVYDELMVLTEKGMRAVSLDEVLGRSCLAEDEVHEALQAWFSFGVVKEEKGILELLAVL